MLEHKNFVKVYHHDTDCYNIVWHGAYIKWFEIGRVEFAAIAGLTIKECERENVMFPVVELNCRYKTPSRLYDEICISTTLDELKKSSIKFRHTITNIKTGALVLEAISTIVTTNKEGKLYRKMPELIYNIYKKALDQE